MKFILLSCIGASCLYTSLVFADIQVDAYTKNTSRTLAKQVQELLKTLPNQVRQQPQYIAKEKRIIALLHRIDVSKNGNRRWGNMVLSQSQSLVRTATLSSVAPITPITPITPIKTETQEIPLISHSTTYYSDIFQGRSTASGDPFYQENFSAASCNYSLGSLIQIRGSSVVTAKVNDRPNCTTNSGVLDLSKRTFSLLEPLSKGRFLSQSQFIAPLPKGWSKSYLASDYFSSLGITLQRAIPSIALAGSTLNLEGTSTSDETLCLLVDPQGNKIVQSFTDGKQFSCSFHLAKAGEYLFVIGSGLKIEKTSTIAKIIVLPEGLSGQLEAGLTQDTSEDEGTFMIRKQDVRTVGKEVQTVLEFRNQKALYTVVFEQSGIRKQYSGIGNIAVPINDLEGFSSQKETLFSVYIQSVSTEFDIDVLRSKKLIRQQKILLVPASSSTQESTLYLTHAESRYTLSGMSASDTSSIAFLTLPNGSVEKLSLTHSQTKEILPKKTPIEYTFELETPGEYRFELNDASGFAVINIPIYVGNFFPFLPSKHAQYIENGTQDATGIQQKSLDFINTLRNPSSPITLDATLIKLAQAKAEDMAKFNYLGHYDTQGRAIREFGVARGIEIQGLLGENVAGGSGIPYETLLVGLAESGGHRSNMVDVRFKKVGFGAMQSKGSIYYVQVFGE